MKLDSIFLAAAAAVTANALSFTNANFYNITIGNPFNITWSNASGPVTLTLLKGGTEPFFTNITTIASGVSAASYVWTPAADLTSDTYLIHFQDLSGASAYGFYFALVDAPYSIATTTTKTTAAATAEATTTTSSPVSTYTYP
ncbi:hypothetical protein SEUCBS139899_006957 [Sporothrix eucalyptigena]|uniref:Ser-Thr-rich glycosyl-phosphatidyl-inositol-anchored membrane family-domain-containing protein n=1 Tax=Sporothrix eucalyptigena TaxID=1812306 RepID=A0ABP0C4I7_9PEZI